MWDVTAQDIQSAIWEPPQRQNNELFAIQLRTGVLVMEWTAACLIYGAVFFALTEKKQKVPDPEMEDAEK
jgi:hypothetical protein